MDTQLLKILRQLMKKQKFDNEQELMTYMGLLDYTEILSKVRKAYLEKELKDVPQSFENETSNQ